VDVEYGGQTIGSGTCPLAWAAAPHATAAHVELTLLAAAGVGGSRLH
jgi:hypothetical protein